MEKAYQENIEANELKKLIKKHLALAPVLQDINNKISQILKRQLKIIPEEASKTAWGIIEGVVITKKEREVIELLMKKGSQNNGYKI